MSKIKSLLDIAKEQVEEVNKQIELHGREIAMEMEL